MDTAGTPGPRLPPRLAAGDHVRVVAPSASFSIIPPDQRATSLKRLTTMGLTVSFGDHVEDCNDFFSSSIESRVADLHAAFTDPAVKAVMAVIGGFNANQLLPHLDWDLIRDNPKIFCGYSDTTALSCAMLARSDLITYSGPAYSTFGMRDHNEQTIEWFQRTMFESGPHSHSPAEHWSDDEWYNDQDNRIIQASEGPWVIQEGVANGSLVGGNLCTLNLLQGTPYMPTLAGSVLFLEDDDLVNAAVFDRDLTSLLQQHDGAQIRGLAIGRFQAKSEVDCGALAQIVASKPELAGKPVVANLDFGHTFPLMTIPVGGEAHLAATGDSVELRY